MGTNRSIAHIGTCMECGKHCYTSKKRAKAAAKVLHPTERLAPYACGQWWHFGHLTYAVKNGWNPRGVKWE